MTKLLAGKISTLIAAFTTSMILSGCQTATSGRPELCKTNAKAANCVKPKVAPKAKAVVPKRTASRWKAHNDY